MRARPFALLIATLLCAALPARARGVQDPELRSSGRAGIRERLRARWRERPGGEREILERRLAELERLSPEARRELLDRARRLRERERELLEGSPDEQRARLMELGPEQRRELCKRRLRERGRTLRERMPAEFRRRIESAPGAARERVLEPYLREREEASRRALRVLGARMDLRPAEIQAFERLPLEDRLRTLMALRRRLVERPRPAGRAR